MYIDFGVNFAIEITFGLEILSYFSPRIANPFLMLR